MALCFASNCFRNSSLEAAALKLAPDEVTTTVFVTADGACVILTVKPGFIDDEIAPLDVTNVAAVAFFGWMEMDGLTRTILTVPPLRVSSG